jgi:homoserine acetyltransferase
MAYFEDGPNHDPLQALTSFKGPKLIAHAQNDEFVAFERVTKIYEQLTEPKMFLELHCNHDYRLSSEAIQAIEQALEKFIDKYL